MLAALALAVLTPAASPMAVARAEGSCPSAGPCVVVHLPDGTEQTVSAADVAAAADIHDQQYRTRALPGGATQDEPYIGTGLSVRNLLAGLSPPFDPDAVGFTETSRPDGSWSTLSRADLSTAPVFERGLKPVVRVDGAVLEYVRPLRADAQDVNAVDRLRSGRLDLYVHTGRLLRVSASVQPRQVDPGQPVVLTATSDGATAFTWELGDGSSETGPVVTHRYSGSGRFRVLVTATGPDDSAGAAPPLLVTVGASPSPSPTPRPTASATSGPSPAAPGATGSATPEAGAAHPGASAGPRSPRPRQSGPGPRARDGARSPVPAEPPGPSGGLASTGPLTGSSGRLLLPSVASPPSANPAPTVAEAPAAGARIVGVLLSATSARDEGPTARTSVADRRRSHAGAVAESGAGGLLLVLLALGAIRELGWRHPHWPGRR